MAFDLKALPRQLLFWSGHCLLNAAPSCAIACIYLKYWKRPEALLAMGWAVLAFILFFSFLTSFKGPLTQSGHTLCRAIRAGVKFRMIVSLASLPLFVAQPLTYLVPDLWSGFLATWIFHQIEQLIGSPSTMASTFDMILDRPTFAGVFSIAIIQGLIISLFMFLFSFFAVLVIQRREREKMWTAVEASGHPANE